MHFFCFIQFEQTMQELCSQAISVAEIHMYVNEQRKSIVCHLIIMARDNLNRMHFQNHLSVIAVGVCVCVWRVRWRETVIVREWARERACLVCWKKRNNHDETVVLWVHQQCTTVEKIEKCSLWPKVGYIGQMSIAFTLFRSGQFSIYAHISPADHSLTYSLSLLLSLIPSVSPPPTRTPCMWLCTLYMTPSHCRSNFKSITILGQIQLTITWLLFIKKPFENDTERNATIQFCQQCYETAENKSHSLRRMCNVDDTEPKTICSLIRWSNWLFDLIKLIKYANFSLLNGATRPSFFLCISFIKHALILAPHLLLCFYRSLARAHQMLFIFTIELAVVGSPEKHCIFCEQLNR